MKAPGRRDGFVCGAVLSGRSPACLTRRAPATTPRARSATRLTDLQASGTVRHNFPGNANLARPRSRPSLHRDSFCPRSSLWLLNTFSSNAASADNVPARHLPGIQYGRRRYATARAATAPVADTVTAVADHEVNHDTENDGENNAGTDNDNARTWQQLNKNDSRRIVPKFGARRDPRTGKLEYRKKIPAEAITATNARRKERADIMARASKRTTKDDFKSSYKRDGQAGRPVFDDKAVQRSRRGAPPIARGDVKDLLRQIRAAVLQGVQDRQPQSLDTIYELYCQLPEPKMLHLGTKDRDQLLLALGTPQKGNMDAMLRYCSLITDMREAGIKVRQSQWNFAIASVTQYTSRLSPSMVENALKMWQAMEREDDVNANEVTFSLLFNIASKSGKFMLAEKIYTEMANRGIPFNRYHHVTMIHHYGLRGDASGIRAAYRDMVKSGEMIDTMVLNCIIAGLLRCGEREAADETYRRMRKAAPNMLDLTWRDYRFNNIVSNIFIMFGRVSKKHRELGPSLQTGMQLAPDFRTFKVFVEHYATVVGDINKVAQYLDEMTKQNIAVHPVIFLSLFEGFHKYGGIQESQWTPSRLQNVLAALYQASDAQGDNFRLGRWVAIWALRAVKKCMGNMEVTETFKQLAQRWCLNESEEAFMNDLMTNLLAGTDMKKKQQRGPRSGIGLGSHAISGSRGTSNPREHTVH